ncbi:MAG: ureidoglycolate lyase [Kiloniellales bacterium]|nr:ureidoglycolate lyase [Kiloniellales bacterium]
MTSFDIPLRRATAESLSGYGELVSDPEARAVEIVPWPAPGRRPLDPGTGDQGGTTEGIFEFWWSGDVLEGRNNAVDDQYVLGWTRNPEAASREEATVPRSQVLLWHANYHPDGGQLFFPLDGGPFVAPLALPGDEVRPEHFVGFYFDGSAGLYIHPGVWHEAMFPFADRARFFDRQGKVHARISCDFKQEFGLYLSVPLAAPEGD